MGGESEGIIEVGAGAGSGVADLDVLCSPEDDEPRKAAAVDVDVRAAFNVLNGGAPPGLLRQLA